MSAASDLIFGLGDPLREILHVEVQSGAVATKQDDLLVYNALLFRQYRVPVHSLLLFLRPQAAHSSQDGSIVYQARPDRGKMDFGYEIVRLWERPAEELLTGPLAAVPLAPLGKTAGGRLDS